MKLLRVLLAAFAAALVTVAAHAADIAGNWKWTSVSKSGGPAEVIAALALKAGVLTGTVTGRQGPATIADATFKDDNVAFTVTRSSGTSTVVFKYSGHVSGDTLTGTIEKTGPTKDAPVTKTEWKATRVK
jgi:hypothetical protein